METIEILSPGFVPHFNLGSITNYSILETNAVSIPYVTEVLIQDESAFRAKVRRGANFRFNWVDGNMYELPVAALYCYNMTQKDVLGLEHEVTVARLQVNIIGGDLKDYQVV